MLRLRDIAVCNCGMRLRSFSSFQGRAWTRNSQRSIIPGVKGKIEGVGPDTMRWAITFSVGWCRADSVSFAPLTHQSSPFSTDRRT